jgi:multiple sugar transport system permease protein
MNSLIAATGTAALNLVLGTLAGYALASFRFPGARQPARPLSRLAAAARIALIVPLYLTIKNFGLLDHCRR